MISGRDWVKMQEDLGDFPEDRIVELSSEKASTGSMFHTGEQPKALW